MENPEDQDAPVALERFRGYLHLRQHFPGVICRYQMLQPVLYPLYWAPDLHCGEGDEEILWVEFAPYPEATSYVLLDEMYLLFRHLQVVGKYAPVEVWNLGGTPHRQIPGILVIARNHSPGLHRIASVAMGLELLFPGVVGLGESRLHITEQDVGGGGEGDEEILRVEVAPDSEALYAEIEEREPQQNLRGVGREDQ